jgi:putative acetyltransferase
MIEVQIREDDLTGPEIARFLQAHLDRMYEITPPESVHALDLDGLRAPGITFWSAWAGSELLGCGALRELDPRSGEVKSMRTAPEHRGRGVGSRILEHLIAVAERRAYERLYLETGAMPEFAPARALYRRYGFEYRGPFADYREDPNSVYMEKRLQESEVRDRGSAQTL